MYKCREASTKEIIAFQKEFCENLSAAIGMNNKHRVQVESYEELRHGVLFIMLMAAIAF